MRPILFLLTLITTALFWSCQKEPQSPYILVNPGDLQIQADAGDLIEFKIQAFAGDAPLSQVIIRQKPVGGLTSTVLDTLVSGVQTEFYYVYAVPGGTEDIVMLFEVKDAQGYNGETARRLVISGNEFLQETSGHELYSRFAISNNAFNIADANAMSLAADPDSTMVDLVAYDLDDDEMLSNSIHSYSGIEFVRNNSFNYAAATNASAQATYESSSPQEIISNIVVNDILVTRYDTINNYFAVIKITDIDDEAGDENDRFTFNLKKLP